MNQLDRIIEVTGRPSPEDIEAINSPFAATMLESLPPSNPRSLSDMFPDAAPEALDALRQFLQFNPNKRVTAEVPRSFSPCSLSLFLSLRKRARARARGCGHAC
jgi:hypothetical protein